MSGLRVGFVSARNVSLDGGTLWADAGVGRVINALHGRFGGLELGMCMAEKRAPLHDERLAVSQESFHRLPHFTSVATGVFEGGGSRAVIREIEARCDVVLVQLPFAAFTGLLSPGTPRVYHACANIFEVVRSVGHYRGLKRVPALTLARVIDFVQGRLIARDDSGLVANGDELHQRYGSKGRSVVSATLLDSEIGSVKRSRPPGGRFRVLYVGYMRAEKGFGTLLDACSRVMRASPGRLELRVVGASDAGDRGVGDTLRRGLDELRRLGDVDIVGARPFGPQLFQEFADADVLVLPSLSEGTPRVLVEARAFGCPVVATRVGGVPTSVTHEVDGLMVPPADPNAIAGAVERMMGDPELHQRLVDGGLRRARASTIERFAEVIGDELVRVAELKPSDALRPHRARI